MAASRKFCLPWNPNQISVFAIFKPLGWIYLFNYPAPTPGFIEVRSLEPTYEWYKTVCLSLPYCTWQNVLQFQPCCCKWQDFFFHSWIIFLWYTHTNTRTSMIIHRITHIYSIFIRCIYSLPTPPSVDTKVVISFSCLIILVRASNTMLNRNGKSEHPCPAPDFRGKSFSFSPLSMWD